MSFLQLSFSGAVTILTVLLIRTAARSRLPKKIFPILWWIVLLRLFLPFSIPTKFSIYSLANQHGASVIDSIADGIRFGDTATASDGTTGTPNQEAAVPETASGSTTAASNQEAAVLETAPPVFHVLIWGTGAISCAVYFMITWIRCRMEFRTSLPAGNPFIGRWLKEHPLKRPISVRQSDKINAPLTYGLFYPVILLPKKTTAADPEQLRYILMHEYVHICRFDVLLKFFAAAALCLHWFNPLVWAMYYSINRDIELACDESVIRRLGEDSCSDYAQMLIHMEAQKSGIAPLFSNLNKTAIEERIISIMKMKKINKKTALLPCTAAIALFLLVAVVFSATASAKNSAIAEEMTVESSSDSPDNPDDYLPAAKADFEKEGPLLHDYEKFDISYDKNGKIYYKDQLVRYFWDGAEIKENNKVIGWTVRYEYLNEAGTVDVHTIRKTEYSKDGNMNLCGPVTGMQACSQTEFNSRDIKALTHPNRISVAETDDIADNQEASSTTDSYATAAEDSQKPAAAAGNSDSYATAAEDNIAIGGRSFAEIFAEYAPYGITYTETKEENYKNGKLFYNGQPVQVFSDTSGETAFSFSSGADGIHVQAIRDKNGKLTDVRPVS
ncbi:MAG: M56 family metallopeptidase [Eubacterium sp.]|nr:M56 family metallopeptidase [Eubacterium sp.]